jgi:hypothetical protein
MKMGGISGAGRAGVAVLALALAAWAGEPECPALIIDHNCVDLAVIPEDYLLPASSLRVLVRHASVGQGIVWGLDCLAGAHPTNPACSCFPAGRYDRVHWVFEPRLGNWREKIDDLAAQTAARTDEFDVFMSKFCYIDALGDSHPDWEYCCGRMEQLEADYPDKTFVWWTIPLTRDGQPGTDGFNAQMRAYCAGHRKVLFDLADIECHDANGVKLVNAQGNEVISQDYTKEIHAGHLNPAGRVRVASAFWHLMARLAGWDPRPEEPNAVPSDPNMIPPDPNMAPLDPNIVPSDANNVAGGPQAGRDPSCATDFRGVWWADSVMASAAKQSLPPGVEMASSPSARSTAARRASQ